MMHIQFDEGEVIALLTICCICCVIFIVNEIAMYIRRKKGIK